MTEIRQTEGNLFCGLFIGFLAVSGELLEESESRSGIEPVSVKSSTDVQLPVNGLLFFSIVGSLLAWFGVISFSHANAFCRIINNVWICN